MPPYWTNRLQMDFLAFRDTDELRQQPTSRLSDIESGDVRACLTRSHLGEKILRFPFAKWRRPSYRALIAALVAWRIGRRYVTRYRQAGYRDMDGGLRPGLQPVRISILPTQSRLRRSVMSASGQIAPSEQCRLSGAQSGY